MKKIFKSVMVLILVIVMTITCLPFTASADIGDNDFDEVEFNNSIITADRIYNDYTVYGYCGGTDMDYFKLVLFSSSTIKLTLVGDNSHLYIGIIDSTDEIIAAEKTAYVSSTNGYGTQLVKSVSAGTYYILLLNEENYYSNSYAFYVDVKSDSPQTGWFSNGGKWYYYENGNMVKNAWRKDSIGWVYLGKDGAMLTNAWCTDSQGWCYVGADGYAVTNCWKQDSIGWCFLGANGSQVKNNWVFDGGCWYFIDADGYMVSNQWRKDSKGWVYLGSNGAMLTNSWCTDSQGWCYVGADGYALTNCWKKDSIGWIWLDGSGSMTKAAWVLDGGNWYYLNAEGYMVTGRQYIDGVWYNFNTSGVWVG